MIDLKKAIEFHGHLGPYLVLGLRAGDLALDKLHAKKYFGIEVTVHCPENPPPRCFIDGIQLSTGATFGKGNLHHEKNDTIIAIIKDKSTGNSIHITLNEVITKQLQPTLTVPQLETLAQKIATEPVDNILNIILQ